VISREVRERLKLNPGDTLRYRVTSDGILLNKANEPGAIRSLRFPNGDPRPTKRPMADCRKPGLASWPELDPAIHLFSNRDDRKTWIARHEATHGPRAFCPATPPAACSNLVLFSDRVSQIGHLQLVSSEDVDWEDWRTKNRRA
jgi:hypothetical protein